MSCFCPGTVRGGEFGVGSGDRNKAALLLAISLKSSVCNISGLGFGAWRSGFRDVLGTLAQKRLTGLC